MTYSQNDEEAVIGEFFAGRVGTFIDVGAYDGKTFSNTFALVERGWSGYLIEPSTRAFPALRQLHEGRRGLILINALIAPQPGLKRFWESDDAVSTTEKSHFEKWESVGQYHAPVYMPTVTMVDVLAMANGQPIDFLSIDTEGTSVDVLKSYPFGLSQPSLVCVEHDSREPEVDGFLKGHGYSLLASNAENLIFKR